ncbi:hypothetical protein NXW19_20125 [Bacteroides ovatus]|nr:hypothetical protein NXW52_22585 [Bacteroides ovatus]UVP76177.1 hypothetical protein NXW19_20125 [Bacteroides ovatus]
MRMRTSARVSPTINRRTTMGTCPQCRAEGGKPQQKQFFPMLQELECFGKYWKAEKSSVG